MLQILLDTSCFLFVLFDVLFQIQIDHTLDQMQDASNNSDTARTQQAQATQQARAESLLYVLHDIIKATSCV